MIRAQRVLVGIMLAQRRRRWPSITSALGQCSVLSGVSGAGMESVTRIAMQQSEEQVNIEAHNYLAPGMLQLFMLR